jgi:hypothetical protein
MSKRIPYFVTAFVILAAAAWLLWIGREPICKCGVVKLWGESGTSDGSQHLTDWYTTSHIIHGFLFFGLLWLVARRMSVGWRLVIAATVECGWEILENSPIIIERYRAVTISLDYYGDAVINSVSDIVFMVLGFWAARALPVWASVAIVIGLEALTMAVIRDGLALNVLMLVYPLDAVRAWQAGG